MFRRLPVSEEATKSAGESATKKRKTDEIPVDIGYVLDEGVKPRDCFQERFEEISLFVHQAREAGRRWYLDLFLLDIIIQLKDKGLRIFPEMPVSVENGLQKMGGDIDYTVGFAKGKPIDSTKLPPEAHLVAIEAKVASGPGDFRQGVAEASALFKSRVDKNKPTKRVWGCVTNGKTWTFFHINEAGQLWRADDLTLKLRKYDEPEVLKVYRLLYYCVQQCAECCTPPPTRISSDESIDIVD